MDTLPCLLYRERNCTPVKVTVAYITRGASTRDAIGATRSRVCPNEFSRNAFESAIRLGVRKAASNTGLTSPFLPNYPRPNLEWYSFFTDDFCWMDCVDYSVNYACIGKRWVNVLIGWRYRWIPRVWWYALMRVVWIRCYREWYKVTRLNAYITREIALCENNSRDIFGAF